MASSQGQSGATASAVPRFDSDFRSIRKVVNVEMETRQSHIIEGSVDI